MPPDDKRLNRDTERPVVSVIVPAFNEAESIGATLKAIRLVRGCVEVIVVDGSSSDKTALLARELGVRVVITERGRGLQLHSGAGVATGEILWFLHADTEPPPDAAERIVEALARDARAIGGNFEIRFDGDSRAARFLTWLYPRLGKFGLCYGDSGIFVRSTAYRQVGGFEPFPIFEDLDLVRRLRKIGPLVHLPVTVITYSRRFEKRSFALAFARWALLQGLYWAGVHPRTLARYYAPIRRARVPR